MPTLCSRRSLWYELFHAMKSPPLCLVLDLRLCWSILYSFIFSILISFIVSSDGSSGKSFPRIEFETRRGLRRGRSGLALFKVPPSVFHIYSFSLSFPLYPSLSLSFMSLISVVQHMEYSAHWSARTRSGGQRHALALSSFPDAWRPSPSLF